MSAQLLEPMDSQIDHIILRMARTGRVGNRDLDTLILHIRRLHQIASIDLLDTSVPPIEK